MLGKIFNWINENKDWLFSGVAIAIPISITSWLLSGTNNRQVQKGGKNSTNIQVGGSLDIAKKDKDE